MFCGRRSNQNFLNAIRPKDTDADVCKKDPIFCNHKAVKSGDICPKGYRLCPGSQSIENRICIKSVSDCPINNIKAVQNNRYYPGYEKARINSQISLAFSKSQNKQPLTSFKLDFQACMNPDENGHPVIKQDSNSQTYYNFHPSEIKAP